LLYRLEHQDRSGSSRLPMTVNLVFWQVPPSSEGLCKAHVAFWSPPENLSGAALATWARSNAGPLNPGALSRLKSLEVNLQSVRWPSTVRPDLGGHAEYLLRVFHREAGGKLVPATLENSPDVARLTQDKALREELRVLLSTARAQAEVEEGTLVLPEKFLATKATSVAPHGLSRWANRPFRQLFAPSDFAEVGFKDRRLVRNSTAFLRRLDGMSCAGCHQSRSIAGFHFLGEDPPEQRADAIELAMSPHLHREVHRRFFYLASLEAGRAPDKTRPHPERDSDGEYASRCGLPGSGFEALTCAPGLSCNKLEDAELGVCLNAASTEVGDPCEVGLLQAKAHPHRDRMQAVTTRRCRAAEVCEQSSVGFPLGMCSAGCDQSSPHATCGAIAILAPFNDCLARGRPKSECLEHVRPAGLRACDRHSPCRDDYVCARTSAGKGACLPPYFLFQLRVDGHR
jgi:hypothetical protein